MHFMKKNIPAKWDQMFISKRNVPPKQYPGIMKEGSLIGGMIYFHITDFDLHLTEAFTSPG